MSNAPFHIGQKVVCIEDSHSFGMPHNFKKNDPYTIKDIDYFPECSGGEEWGVKIVGEIFWYNATRFAPIQTNYADATAEILEKFKQTNEQPDKVIIPIKEPV